MYEVMFCSHYEKIKPILIQLDTIYLLLDIQYYLMTSTIIIVFRFETEKSIIIVIINIIVLIHRNPFK